MLSEVGEPARALRDSKTKMLEAQERERKRIPRELHDDVAQELVLAEFQLAEISAEVSSAVTSSLTTFPTNCLRSQPTSGTFLTDFIHPCFVSASCQV